MPVTVAPLPSDRVGRAMESEATPIPGALDLPHCLAQVPSFTAAPSPEEWWFPSPHFSSSVSFVLPTSYSPHIKEEKLHPTSEGG